MYKYIEVKQFVIVLEKNKTNMHHNAFDTYVAVIQRYEDLIAEEDDIIADLLHAAIVDLKAMYTTTPYGASMAIERARYYAEGLSRFDEDYRMRHSDWIDEVMDALDYDENAQQGITGAAAIKKKKLQPRSIEANEKPKEEKPEGNRTVKYFTGLGQSYPKQPSRALDLTLAKEFLKELELKKQQFNGKFINKAYSSELFSSFLLVKKHPLDIDFWKRYFIKLTGEIDESIAIGVVRDKLLTINRAYNTTTQDEFEQNLKAEDFLVYQFVFDLYDDPILIDHLLEHKENTWKVDVDEYMKRRIRVTSGLGKNAIDKCVQLLVDDMHYDLMNVPLAQMKAELKVNDKRPFIPYLENHIARMYLKYVVIGDGSDNTKLQKLCEHVSKGVVEQDRADSPDSFNTRIFTPITQVNELNKRDSRDMGLLSFNRRISLNRPISNSTQFTEPVGSPSNRKYHEKIIGTTNAEPVIDNSNVVQIKPKSDKVSEKNKYFITETPLTDDLQTLKPAFRMLIPDKEFKLKSNKVGRLNPIDKTEEVKVKPQRNPKNKIEVPQSAELNAVNAYLAKYFKSAGMNVNVSELSLRHRTCILSTIMGLDCVPMNTNAVEDKFIQVLQQLQTTQPDIACSVKQPITACSVKQPITSCSVKQPSVRTTRQPSSIGCHA
jgi:hypothetical protein